MLKSVNELFDGENVKSRMFVNRASGVTQTGMAYLFLIDSSGIPVDDSDHDFNPTSGMTWAAGGKLTYVINPVCIPVNEIIDFETAFIKTGD